MDGQSVRCSSASDISPACAVSVFCDLLAVRTALGEVMSGSVFCVPKGDPQPVHVAVCPSLIAEKSAPVEGTYCSFGSVGNACNCVSVSLSGGRVRG